MSAELSSPEPASAEAGSPEPGARMLDLRGLLCPLPALRTRKMLRQMRPGELLIVECTDPLSVVDIPHLAQERGDALERQATAEGLFIFHIRLKQS